MYSTHEGYLDIPSLPLAACQVHVVPDLEGHSLLSMGQLCDAGCEIAFTKSTLSISYNDTKILTGIHTASSRLWHVNMPNLSPSQDLQEFAKSTIGGATPADLVNLAHGSLLSPVLLTLAMALKKGFLVNFPGLTLPLLRKHPPHSKYTVMGHLNQLRQNTQSTKPTCPTESPEDFLDSLFEDYFPLIIDLSNQPTEQCFVAIQQSTGMVFTDQPGKILQESLSGMNYIMILYNFDSNCILVEALKSRHTKAILEGYKVLHKRLCVRGLCACLQCLDNECSNTLKEFV